MINAEDPWVPYYIVTFGVAFTFSALFTALSILLCNHFGIMDEAGPGTTHEKSTPRLGGPAIWLAMMVALGLSREAPPEHVAILVGGALVLVVGVLDDVRRVHAVVKLICLAIATGVMCTQGVSISLFSNPWANYAVSLVWTVGVVSAMNAIDNMDGLAGGLSFIAACLFFFVGLQTGQFAFAAISIAIGGATLGFLAFNRPPAQIFLGDSGAFLLGYALAATGIMGNWSTHPVKASLVPILILGVPLVDLGYVVLKRWVTGETHSIVDAITYRGHDHLSHRLEKAGFSKGYAVLVIFGLAAAGGILAVAMRNSRPTEAVLLLMQIILVYGLFYALLEKVKNGGDGEKE